MEEIARDTGGAAYINTNGLTDAVARVIDQGSYFYTITYTPTNTANDGKFRKIQIKLAQGEAGDKLAYRRGYYAADTKEAKADAAKPAGDPLHPFMGPGMPNSTQIPMALRVQLIATQPGAAEPGRQLLCKHATSPHPQNSPETTRISKPRSPATAWISSLPPAACSSTRRPTARGTASSKLLCSFTTAKARRSIG